MVHALVDADDCVMIDNLATGFDGAIEQEASLVIFRPAHRRIDGGAPRCSNGYDCWGESAAVERAAVRIHLIRSDSHAPLSVKISLEHREKRAQAGWWTLDSAAIERIGSFGFVLPKFRVYNQ
jgi:hypothetical protein